MQSILGGVFIGLAVSLMLLFNGKVTGVSGIVGNLLKPFKAESSWRAMFVLGLIGGGFILKFIAPESFNVPGSLDTTDYVIAGLLVGIGTTIGNGCTSGHGVCGISRFSIRSIIATITFMSFGILSVIIFNYIKG